MNITPRWNRGGRALEVSDAGIAATESYLVEAVGGDPQTRLVRIVADPRIPRQGSVHPQLGRVDSVSVDTLDDEPDVFEVVVSYRPLATAGAPTASDPEGAVLSVELDSGSIIEETIRDIRGEIMRSQFSGVTSFASSGGGTSLTISKRSTGRVSVERPQLAVHLTTFERSLPIQIAIRFQSTVNAVNWSGFPPRTWLFRGLRSRRIDGGHEATWTFVYNSATWQAVIVHSEGGLIPADVAEGNGIERFDVYEPANWSSLPRIPVN